MRHQYRDILEEAVAASANREDFDEMLLRATKRHLPVRYHSHFISMLEEILALAEKMEMTNRQAARAILESMDVPPASKEPARHQPADPKGAVAVPAATAQPTAKILAVSKEVKVVVAPSNANGSVQGVASSPQPADSGPPEASKILDLGGVRPDTLSQEVRNKLSRMVKARKEKAEWDGDSGDEADARLFFKGSQRCPPQIPSRNPQEPAAEKGEAGPSPKSQDDSEEE